MHKAQCTIRKEKGGKGKREHEKHLGRENDCGKEEMMLFKRYKKI